MSKMQHCTENETPISQDNSLPTVEAEQKRLCQYTMERLFSFSILAARVFSLGDPANHPEGTLHTCT
uniref:Uncharacterized protein n=1 Tax=Sphaeramia orbicularis TaxID=375764 RepID=A0A673CXP8_9TELE